MKTCQTLKEAQAVPGVIHVNFENGKPVAYCEGDTLPAELTRAPDANAEKIEELKAQITPYMVACALAGDTAPLADIMGQIQGMNQP